MNPEMNEILKDTPPPSLPKEPLFEIDWSNIAFAWDRGANYLAIHFLGLAFKFRASWGFAAAWKEGYGAGVGLATGVGKEVADRLMAEIKKRDAIIAKFHQKN